ncbi:response regulator [Chenggangzhangella methanolivorans]
MAHGLVAQLGGALTIQSQSGLGTNVELWLPISSAVASLAEVSAPPAAPASRRGLALLVDDEEIVRASTADMLEEIGFRVQEASSAEAALSLVAEGARPDLLVTDHLMPGMSGVETGARSARATARPAGANRLRLRGSRRDRARSAAADQTVPER